VLSSQLDTQLTFPPILFVNFILPKNYENGTVPIPLHFSDLFGRNYQTNKRLTAVAVRAALVGGKTSISRHFPLVTTSDD
jgi:hypothetical protein